MLYIIKKFLHRVDKLYPNNWFQLVATMTQLLHNNYVLFLHLLPRRTYFTLYF